MAKTKTIRVTEQELLALNALRAAEKAGPEMEPTEKETVISDSQQALADAFVSAIERTRPPSKKHIGNRKVDTPWMPKDGSPRLKLRRKMYHHGMEISDKISNEEIALLNRIKPGHYCDGVVKVRLRKDRGLDIDYPINTASQRLKLVNQYGITSFTTLLQRLADEGLAPRKYRKPEDADLYDLEEP